MRSRIEGLRRIFFKGSRIFIPSKFIVLISCGMYFLMGCSTFRTKDLVGNWRGTAVIEEGDSLKIDPRIIRFNFNRNEGYYFKSTLNYEESGTYFIDHRSLITTDTLNKASSEKSVEIMVLSHDSLHLKMRDGGKDRILKLARIQ
jgi:hypothetical protein